MAPPRKHSAKAPLRPDGFSVSVTQEIGFVEYVDERGIGPVEAAFLLIGKHLQSYVPGDGSGAESFSEYSFPHDEGRTVRVSVDVSA